MSTDQDQGEQVQDTVAVTIRDPRELVHLAKLSFEKDQKAKNKKVRKYNKTNSEFIDSLYDNHVIPRVDKVELNQRSEEDMPEEATAVEESTKTPQDVAKWINRRAVICSRVSLAINILLLIAKIGATIPSNSIAIISSVLDSAVDIFSSAIAWYTGHSINRVDIYKHPQGKTRLEPLAVIIISCVMAITSFQVITESIKRIVTKNELVPQFSFVSLGIIAATIVTKIILFVYCFVIKSPTAQVLAQDHRNDVFSNTVVLIGFVLSRYVWDYSDSVGAMLLSVYILINWILTGKSQIGRIIGKTAPPQAIQLYTWVSAYHDDRILSVDSVRAYGFGSRYLVEVDIVLAEDMKLNTAHNIGEGLQNKLEALPDVERAFVHLDYETSHRADEEHKLGMLF